MKAAAWILGVTLLLTFGYFHRDGGFNQNTRFDLTRAIVEHGSIVIDPYHGNTLDKAVRDGHYYCDKPPGVSWLAVPGYAAARAVASRGGSDPGARERLRWTFYAARLFAVSLAGVALVVIFLRTVGPLCSPGWAVFVTVALALGTLVFPYSTVFYGHTLAAAALFWSFSVLLRHRRGPAMSAPVALLCAGVAAGVAGVADYPAFLCAAFLGLYLLGGAAPVASAAWFTVGMALPVGALLAYHDAAFGSPLSTGFAHEALPFWREKYGAGFYGISIPRLDAIVQLTVGGRRGLFYGAPWLLLALPGLWSLIRDRRWVAEAGLVVAILLTLLALNAGLHSWDGGWTMGARYLIPAIPFLAFASAFVPARLRWPLGLVLVPPSILFMLAGTAVMPEVPVFVLRPLPDFLLPYFFAGKLSVADPRGEAFNLGEALGGLEGLRSLVPLLVLWCVAGAGLVATVRRGTWPARR